MDRVTPAFADQILGALDAVRIEGDGTYRWFGERFPGGHDPGGPPLPPHVGRLLLTRRVQARLYADFFTQGSAAPSVDRRHTAARQGREDLLPLLEEACGAGTRAETGWTVVVAEGPRLQVRRDGLTISVARDEVVAPGRPAPGADVAILLPAGLRNRSPGHYLAVGRASGEGSAPQARVYLNLLASAAAAVAGRVTGALDAAAIPFRLKVLSDSSAYARCDAGVLYVGRDHLPAACDVIASAVGDLDAVKPAVPAMTLPVMPGVATADDPGGGESFGLHRCRLLAAAIVAAGAEGGSAMDALRTARRMFEEAGTSVDAPFAGRTSADVTP